MKINYEEVGSFIAAKRKDAGLTQSELGNRLNVSAQSVSNWERGESLPDTGILPDLALILGTTVDAMLGGGSAKWIYKRRVTVEQISYALTCIEELKNILGADHYMYRTMIDALDKRMNSTIEMTFAYKGCKEAYIVDAIEECVRNGCYVDRQDIEKNIANPKARESCLEHLTEMGIK